MLGQRRVAEVIEAMPSVQGSVAIEGSVDGGHCGDEPDMHHDRPADDLRRGHERGERVAHPSTVTSGPLRGGFPDACLRRLRR